jgi:methionyl-tRNA formyltransferase
VRIVFLGTPAFAVPALEGLLASGHEIPLVVTQPDRPKGRGQAVASSPVKECALRHGLDVFQPERVRRQESVERLAAVKSELMVVVGYGQIIPQSILDLPPRGILNVHASLLPKYRGAAPVQWAIANGEKITGVTIMKIDAGLDTGDMLLKGETGIGGEETAPEVADRLAAMGAKLLLETLARLDEIRPEKQDAALATYAPILKKEDGRIDWSRSAGQVHDRIRGLQPWPGAYTSLRGQTLHIWKSRPAGRGDLPPGRLRVERRRLLAGCGEGTLLELRDVQLEGKKRMDAGAFANGQRLTDNDQFGS